MQTGRLEAAVVAAVPGYESAAFAVLAPGFDCVALAATGADGVRRVFKFPKSAIATRRLRTEAAVLAVLRPAVTLPVPELRLHEGATLFSSHPMIPGAALLREDYEALGEADRARLAGDLARFAAEVHAIPVARMVAAGAGHPPVWQTAGAIRERAFPFLSPETLRRAGAALEKFEALPPDPFGEVFGQFDGHGWNMAFDHVAGRLNGLFDFGDSGVGPLHQDFVYSAFVSPDLTERMVRAYRGMAGRDVDLARIRLLCAVNRLQELAEAADDPAHRTAMLRNVEEWTGW